MKPVLVFAFSLLATGALAHPGHMDVVDGHTHTFFELLMMGAPAAVLGLVLLAIYVAVRRFHD